MKLYKLCLAGMFLAGSLSAGIVGKSTLPKYMLSGEKALPKIMNDEIGVGKYIETTQRNYHVRNYNLSIDWYDAMKSKALRWNGKVEITVEARENNLSQIELDSKKLIINSVLDPNGRDIQFSVNTERGTLVCDLNSPLENPGDTTKIIIDYTYDGDGKIGFISGEPENHFKQSFGIYTMSEPKDARYWVPCNDISIDRSTWTKSIKMPTGYIAVSNGTMIDSCAAGDTITYTWRHDFPMPTYLQAVTASNYQCVKDSVAKLDGTFLPITYYTWPAYIQNKRISQYDVHPHAMNFFNNFFFEYPYEKYGVVSVYKMGGGMEHSTLTTADANWIEYGFPDGMVHELAHQWLGNYITCADWQDLWINEGGATWSENRWNGDFYNMNYFYRALTIDKQFFLNSGNYIYYPIYGLNDDILFNEALTYRKAGWVYQMLYDAIGEEKFKQTLQKIFETYPLQSITTQQFRDIVKQENPDYPISWDTFFSQWLLYGVYPNLKIDYSTSRENDKFINEVSVMQFKQSVLPTGPEVFEIPIKIVYRKSETDSVITTHFMKDLTIEFADTLDFVPESYYYYQFATLSRVDNTTSVEDVALPGEIAVYPQPAKSGESINIRFDEMFMPENVKYEIFDMLGETVALGSLFSKNEYVILPNLASGTYFIKISSGDKKYFKTLIIAN